MATTRPPSAPPDADAPIAPPSPYDRFLAYWVSHGPALVAISLLLSHADPAHSGLYNDLAILAATLLGGSGPPPTLNGQGLGKLANRIAARRRANQEADNATNASK